jgi:hypothetical protein
MLKQVMMVEQAKETAGGETAVPGISKKFLADKTSAEAEVEGLTNLKIRQRRQNQLQQECQSGQ